LSRQIWLRKYAALGGVKPGRLHLVAVSRWLANEAKRSTLLRNFPVSVIPNGLDTEDFRQRDKEFAREILRIPRDTSVVLFVAEPVNRPTKGFSLLIQTLNGIHDSTNLLLVSMGSGRPPSEVKVPYLNLGHIRNDRVCSLAYNAADVFVISSLQDNLPNTVLEAMACGTPVVGFAVGGVPDMVRHGVTGLLVPPQDVAALRTAICELLKDPVRRIEMAANCRDIAVKEYSLEIQSKRHVELYESILADARL
jgi:glycosyltransferase involved in cell wall biosynthesis